MSDIYASPAADLDNVHYDDAYGSLERGIAGDYQFSIGDTISEAWERTRGAKLTFNLAFLLYFVIYAVIVGITTFALGGLVTMNPGETPGAGFFLGSLLQQLIVVSLTMPLGLGLFLLGLRRAVDAPISPMRILGHYDRTLPLLATYVVMTLLLFIGFLLLVIPGIYLMVAFALAMPLVVEKRLGPWEALSASRKAIGKRWFAALGFGLALTVINVIAALPLGIGLIWTLPFSVIAGGVFYRNVFGCEADTRAA
jgi:hypothetical protein